MDGLAPSTGRISYHRCVEGFVGGSLRVYDEAIILNSTSSAVQDELKTTSGVFYLQKRLPDFVILQSRRRVMQLTLNPGPHSGTGE